MYLNICPSKAFYSHTMMINIIILILNQMWIIWKMFQLCFSNKTVHSRSMTFGIIVDLL